MKLKAVKYFLGGAALIAAGCGGGGGGGGSSSPEAAEVSVSASPSKIDSGDRTTVTVNIDSINPLGAMIKIRFPSGLAYVKNSSVLFVDGKLKDASPAFNKTADTDSYLVYFFSRSTIGENQSGRLELTLTGKSGVEDGHIEVDADVNDPNVADSKEFDAANPKFDAQDKTGIRVKDGATEEPTPTPD